MRSYRRSGVTSNWPKVPPELSEEQQRAREGFMKLWHEILPKKYGMIEKFNHSYVASLPLRPSGRTLEIGAGLGAHMSFENLGIQNYHCVELREEFVKELRRKLPEKNVVQGDIQGRLPWSDRYFDRILAIHVLEHLSNLPAALDEVLRLLRPDGFFDVVLPCEGGMAYSMARKISAQRVFEKNFGIDYMPIIRNEHINTFSEVMHLLKERFEIVKGKAFPFGLIPVADVNLCAAYRLKPKR